MKVEAPVSRLLFLVLIAFGGIASALADSPAVTAVLTDSETAVGRPVQLQIQVTGTSNPRPPGEIEVDGLDIRSAGTSRQIQMQNFSISYSFTITYTIMPLRAGRFEIPPQIVEAGGKSLQTPALALNVVASPGSSARPDRSATPNIDPAQIGFIEMLLPKTVAYVGEMIPVQLRVGMHMRTPIISLQGSSGLQLLGQGFTTQRMSELRETSETINGRPYRVFIVNTAISAARTGNLEIGPAEISPVIQVPRSGQRNPGFPRDLLDDPFFNNLFSDPALAGAVPKTIKLTSKPATLEVKPLPPDPPASFNGAIGNFTLKAEASPRTARVGDPITVTATVHGRGNFDRLSAPVLADERGWHTYPSSDQFKQDDDVGISGAKTFTTVLSAREPKDRLPPVILSFFDPVKEKYVSLQSDPIPLRIEGGAATAAATPAIAPSLTPPPSQPADILAQIDDRLGPPRSFTSLHASGSFWWAQVLPLLALLGFIGWRWLQIRRGDREAQRVARLEHEASELHRKLRAHSATPQQYLADASRAVQLKTALLKNIAPSAVDAETAAAVFRLDETSRAHLRRLFEQSDELRYSGGENGNRVMSAERRQEILDLVENLRA